MHELKITRGIKTISLCTVFAVVFASVLYAKERTDKDVRVPNQYIVTLKDSLPDENTVIAELETRHHGTHIAGYHYALKGFAAILPESEIEKIKNDPRVESVVPDKAVSIFEHSKPVSIAAAQVVPTGVSRIGAVGKTNTGVGVNVAVIDTGINTSHPDLLGKVVGGKNCSTGTSYKDGNGHGTHVAGTIAALNNTIGVVGGAPDAKLWAVRVLNNSGYGTWSSVICGIDFVTSKAPANGGPIKVANMSLGGTGSSDDNCGFTNNDPFHKALCRSRDAGVVYVVAAGNDGADVSNSVPASYDDVVITVSALADSDGVSGGVGFETSYGADDTFATFSNFGSAVDLGAPGVDILSTWLRNGYATISGTSMAAPHVTASAALYIALHPSALLDEVKNALTLTGEPVLSGHTDPSGVHPEPVVRADSL